MPANITVQQYTPSEIIGIFNEILAHQNNQASGKLVCISGLYLAGNGISYGGFFYDALRDETTPVELPIKISETQRKDLTPGNKVEILGTLGRKITPKSEIKLELNVSRVEVVQEQVIDENEVKRIEYRQRKVADGFKNVDAILETLLFNGTRPQIALVIAQSSITLKDFEDGIRAARVAIDFFEERVAFTQTKILCNKLKELDQRGYHAIAIVRGGGIDPNTDVDVPEVIETVVGMKTPIISGLGHQPEKIFLRQVADKWTANPQGLGQYFSEIVESTNEKKTKSQAVLTEQIKKQFQKQIDESNKKNKELLEQVEKMRKASQEQTKSFNENLKKQQEENAKNLQKQQEENKKNLEAQQKKNEEALAKFQAQSKQQMETANKQNVALQKQLEELGKSQKSSIDQLTKQAKEANDKLDKERQHSREIERQLSEALANKGTNIWMIVAIIAILALMAMLIFK